MTFGRRDDIILGMWPRMMRRVGSVALTAGVLAAASAFVVTPAHAVGLFNGSALSVNGLDISVANCQLTLAGVNQSDCSVGNLEIVADTGPGASIRIQGAGGGNIFSAALGSGLYDVLFTLNISAINPGTTITSAGLAMFGSTAATPFLPIAAGSLVSVGETVTPSGGSTQAMNINLAAATSASVSFAPVGSLSVVKDLKLNAAIPGVGTLTLASVTQSYLPAPEPASVGLFLLGVGGLAAVRRRLRRNHGVPVTTGTGERAAVV